MASWKTLAQYAVSHTLGEEWFLQNMIQILKLEGHGTTAIDENLPVRSEKAERSIVVTEGQLSLIAHIEEMERLPF